MNDKTILELEEKRNKLLKEVKQIDEVLENEIYKKYIGLYVVEPIR